MTIQEFKTHIEEELRNKLRGENKATPILDRLDKHLTDFDGYDLTDLLNPKNMKHDLYASFLFQICFPSRIKMEIDAEYTPIKKKRIAIVSCKSQKQDYPCSADEMYEMSHIYKAQREFMIKGYDEFYIVSSKYGIISPSQIIEPYNITLGISARNMKGINDVQGWDHKILNLIETQLNYMVNRGWTVDYHTSMNYYKPLSQDIKKKITHIKQPMGVNAVKPLYDKATHMLDTQSLEECLQFITYRDPNKPKESPRWFFHPSNPPFKGTTGELVTKYSENLNSGALYKLTVGDALQHKGWVVDESLLDNLYQTDSGQWRLKK